MHDDVGVVPFIQVDSSREGRDPRASLSNLANDHLTAMANDRNLGKMRDIPVFENLWFMKLLGKGAQAASQDHGHRWGRTPFPKEAPGLLGMFIGAAYHPATVTRKVKLRIFMHV
jgi:hypothetical protein